MKEINDEITEDSVDKAEEKAKTYNDGKKNAICFFNQCVSWNEEYDEVLQMKNEMLYQINTNGVSKGLLQQLMIYAQMAERGDLKYLWHATYYLTRMIKEKQNSPAKEYLQNLRDKQITRGKAHMLLIAMAARWAEQELRINKH